MITVNSAYRHRQIKAPTSGFLELYQLRCGIDKKCDGGCRKMAYKACPFCGGTQAMPSMGHHTKCSCGAWIWTCNYERGLSGTVPPAEAASCIWAFTPPDGYVEGDIVLQQD